MGCRRAGAPAGLVRVRRDADGRLGVGPGPGRGAWLCAGRVECFDRAVARRALARALRCPQLTTDEIEELRATLFPRTEPGERARTT